MVLSRLEFAQPLTVEGLCSWHRQFLGERMRNAGRWRTEPIWIVFGVAGKEKVHFEGPPASRVAGEMETFVEWFNASGSLTRFRQPILDLVDAVGLDRPAVSARDHLRVRGRLGQIVN